MILDKKMKETATNPELKKTGKIWDEIKNLVASELEIVLSP